MRKSIDVIGLGSPLMDFLIDVDENTLLEFDLKKGEMQLVDHDKATEFLNKIKQTEMKIEVIPGGSSANTLKGVALLGGHVIFCGVVGNDENGQIYEQELQKIGVETKFTKNEDLTGHALTFITPDSQRTFSTHLGAAIKIKPEHVLDDDIRKAKVLHLEGYQIEGDSKDTLLHAIKVAKEANTLVSMDLADPGLIRRNKEFLKILVKNDIDIVFMNEDEAKEFTGLEEMQALNEVAKQVKMAVVKLGPKGSLISYKGETIQIQANAVNAIDTTGAGDSYAAGLLYGFTHNWPLSLAGSLGSLFASRVISQKGVAMKDISPIDLIQQILR